jgi:alpha-tubulin suppressor-like RCC1 family protein
MSYPRRTILRAIAGILSFLPSRFGRARAAGYYNLGGFFKAQPTATTAGTLWAWGTNATGVLGTGNLTTYSSPVQIGTADNWAKVATNAKSTAAIKADGTLWTWGASTSGVLGQGALVNRSSPVQVGSLTNWSNIWVGVNRNTMVALKTDGTLWQWGDLGGGVLRSSPVQVGSDTDWVTVSGGDVVLGIKSNGTLWAFGNNSSGQLGVGTSSPSHYSSPTQVGSLTTWAKCFTGTTTSCAIKTDGTLWVWGKDFLTANNVLRSSPVQVGALTDWAHLSISEFSVLALKTDGTLWASGLNDGYQLGLGNLISRSSPVQVGAQTWSKIATGGEGGCSAIRSDKTLWSWGNNGYGELGLGSTGARSVPTQVGSLSTWQELVNKNGFGEYQYAYCTFAIK